MTLDQHIGVRIPGGQPVFMLVLATPFQSTLLCVRAMSVSRGIGVRSAKGRS
jgi:hypothetical protein